MRETFETWMRRVDESLETLSGFNSEDLPDYGYWDNWNRFESPLSVAKRALRKADNL